MQSRSVVASSRGRLAARGRSHGRGSGDIRSAVAYTVEKLEQRTLLSSYTWNPGAGTLLIDLGTNDEMTIAEASGTRTFHLTTGGIFAANGGTVATGSGTSTITFSAASNIGTSITLNNAGDASPSNESITFLGGNLTSGTISVDLTQTAGTASMVSFTTAGTNFSTSIVTLKSPNTISEGAGGAISATTGSLTTSSVTGTTLGDANAISTFNATNTTSGNISLTNAATTLTVTGISQAGTGSVTVSNTGALNVTGAVAAGSGDIILSSTEAAAEAGTPLPPPDDNITVNGGVTVRSAGGDVNLSSADSMVVGGGVLMSGGTGAINLSIGVGDLDNDANLVLNGTLTSPTVRFTAPGDIYLDQLPSALTNRPGQTTSITSTNGGIFDETTPDGAGDDTDVTAANLALSAARGVGTASDPLETAVGQLAVRNTAAGSVSVANTGALTLAAVDALDGTAGHQLGNFAPGGTSTLGASGPVTYAINYTSQGNLSTTTTEAAAEAGTPLPPPDDNITVNGGVTVRSAGGDVNLSSADSIVVGGGVLMSGGTGAINLSIGQGDVDNDAGLFLNGTLTSPTVRFTSPGDIFFDSLPVALTYRPGQTLAITSTSGGIFDGATPDGAGDDTDVAAANLALSAASGIGTASDPLETAVGQLAVRNTAAGSVCVANTGPLTLAAVDALDGTAGNQLGNFAPGGTTAFTTSGPFTYAFTCTSNGSLTTTTTETASESGSPLPPPDDGITVNSGVTVESTSGDVNLTSSDGIVIQSTGTVKSDIGAINLTIGSGDNDNDASMILNGALSAAGNITLDAPTGDAATLTGMATAAAVVKNGGGSFFVDAPNGSINTGVTVNAGMLGGTGSVTGAVAIEPTATLAPGDNAPGILTTGTDTLSRSSTFSVQLAGPTPGNTPTSYGQLDANGNVDLNNATLAAVLTFSPGATQTFTIIQATGNITGQFAQGSTIVLNGTTYTINYLPHSVVLVASADLSVNVSGPTSAVEGSTASYTYTVSNAGPGVAQNVVFNAPLPSGAVFVSASFGGAFAALPASAYNPTTGMINPGTLAPGSSGTLTLNVKFPEENPDVTFNASVTSSTADPNPSNNSFSLVAKVTDAPLTAQGKTVPSSAGIHFNNATVATYTDANLGALASDFSATINWGDGTVSTAQIVSNGNGTFSVIGSHTYANAKTKSYMLAIKIVDVGGSTATATGTALLP